MTQKEAEVISNSNKAYTNADKKILMLEEFSRMMKDNSIDELEEMKTSVTKLFDVEIEKRKQ